MSYTLGNISVAFLEKIEDRNSQYLLLGISNKFHWDARNTTWKDLNMLIGHRLIRGSHSSEQTELHVA